MAEELTPDEYVRLFEQTPVELANVRVHAKCLTNEEKRLTVGFLNRQRMNGRVCDRCGEVFDCLPSE